MKGDCPFTASASTWSSKQPIVLLKTADADTFLPIWIGHSEAAAILLKLQGNDLAETDDP